MGLEKHKRFCIIRLYFVKYDRVSVTNILNGKCKNEVGGYFTKEHKCTRKLSTLILPNSVYICGSNKQAGKSMNHRH